MKKNYLKISNVVGLITNIILAILKLVIGLLTKSISIMSDAVNNLSDFFVCLLSFLGIKMSNKPADSKHPFGHKRLEYIISLFLNIVIIIIGAQFFIESIKSLINNKVLDISYTTLIILSISILLKIIQVSYYYLTYKKTKIKTLYYLSKDAINDILITLSIVISIIIYLLFKIDIDSYLGIIISIYIMISALFNIKDILDPLIGVMPDEELLENIMNDINKEEKVINCHDLLFHQYGDNKIFLSVHITLSNKLSLDEAHEIIDRIEDNIHKKYNIVCVTHIDPIDIDNDFLNDLKNQLNILIDNLNENIKYYDLRLKNNIISFDVEVPLDSKLNKKEIYDYFMKNLNTKYQLRIKVYDKQY